MTIIHYPNSQPDRRFSYFMPAVKSVISRCPIPRMPNSAERICNVPEMVRATPELKVTVAYRLNISDRNIIHYK